MAHRTAGEWELQHGAGSSGQAGLQTMTLPLLSSFLKPTPKKPKGKDKLNDPEGGPKKKQPKLSPEAAGLVSNIARA